jgi:hypothetical protein
MIGPSKSCYIESDSEEEEGQTENQKFSAEKMEQLP